MKVLAVAVVIVIWVIKALSGQADDARGRADNTAGSGGARQKAKRPVVAVGAGKTAAQKRPSSAEIRDFHERRRADERERSAQRHAAERASSEKRWAAARRQQADAALVHGVHIDSCEGRLESLKVLYDAGILDREEYLQRVSRVKQQHADSRG